MVLEVFSLDRQFYAAVIEASKEKDSCLVAERTLFCHGKKDGTINAPIHIARAMDRVVCCYPARVAARYALRNVAGDTWDGPVRGYLSYRSDDRAMRVQVIGVLKEPNAESLQ